MIINELKNILERNPDLESYLSFDDLKFKYYNDEVFVHFSNNFKTADTKTDMFKMGFNPKQNYNNPYGIYAYPIKEIANFKSDAPMAYFLKKIDDGHNQIDKIDQLSNTEYIRCMDILKSKIVERFSEFEFIEFLKDVEQSSKNKTDGGILFYFIVKLSSSIIGETLFPSNRGNVIQYKIWKNWLDYSFIGDLNGKGIIHPYEPYQVLFLTLSSFKIINQTQVKLNDKYSSNYYRKDYKKLKIFTNLDFKSKSKFINDNFFGVVNIYEDDDGIVIKSRPNDEIWFENDDNVEILPFKISKIITINFKISKGILGKPNVIKSFKNFPDEILNEFTIASGNFENIINIPNCKKLKLDSGYKSIQGIENLNLKRLDCSIHNAADIKFLPKNVDNLYLSIQHNEAMLYLNTEVSYNLTIFGLYLKHIENIQNTINNNLIIVAPELQSIEGVEIVKGTVNLEHCEDLNLNKISILQCHEIILPSKLKRHTEEEIANFKAKVEIL